MPLIYPILISALVFAAAYLLVSHGWAPLLQWLSWQEQAYERSLRHTLMIDIEPRMALGITIGAVLIVGVFAVLFTASIFAGIIAAAVTLIFPPLIIRHLTAKRKAALDNQLVDGLMTLASGVRAGLNLVQAMELLVENHRGPIQQEFAQLLREYQMGMDLNQAMHNASNRIGSPMYRLTFTAIEMHRVRGGDTSESLDRIAESIREIRRLEGRLDALTAQGRTQATMMAVMPIVFLALLYLIDAEGVQLLFTEPLGRMIMLGVIAMIAIAFVWIRRILSIDI